MREEISAVPPASGGGDGVSRTTSQSPIRLQWDADREQFLVSVEDRSRYCMTVDELKRVCRFHEEQKDIERMIDDLLVDLGRWANEHAEKVAHAFFTVRDMGLLFLVVMRGRKYDADLEKDLTDLDLRIAGDNRYRGILLSVLAVPNCGPDGYASFLNPAVCLSYEGIDAE